MCIIAAILPCVFGWFQDKHHYCVKCGKEVAIRHANGGIEVRKEMPKVAGPVAGNGENYQMGNLRGVSRGREPAQQGGTENSDHQQRSERHDEQVSSFLATNTPRAQERGERPA